MVSVKHDTGFFIREIYLVVCGVSFIVVLACILHYFQTIHSSFEIFHPRDTTTVEFLKVFIFYYFFEIL